MELCLCCWVRNSTGLVPPDSDDSGLIAINFCPPVIVTPRRAGQARSRVVEYPDEPVIIAVEGWIRRVPRAAVRRGAVADIAVQSIAITVAVGLGPRRLSGRMTWWVVNPW